MLPKQQEKQSNLKLIGESPAWLERARQLQADRQYEQVLAEQRRVQEVRDSFREWQGERLVELFALLDLLGIPANREVDAVPGEAKVIAHSDYEEWVEHGHHSWQKPYAIVANLKVVAPDRAIWNIDPPKRPGPFANNPVPTEKEYETALEEWRKERKLITASFIMDYEPSDPELWQAIYDRRAERYHWEWHTDEESPHTKQRINKPGKSASEMLRGDDLLVAFADAIDVITAKVATMTAEYEAHLAKEAVIVEGDTIPTPAELEAEQAAFVALHRVMEKALCAIAPKVGNVSHISLIDSETWDGIGVELALAAVHVLEALELAGYELCEVSDDE